ncbi:MAG: hypothetical protein GY729_10615 [Desulfobacteraceae bacterium]|nr:hypothetical protein [Desulfobacteraceae bacterium]
MILKRYRWPGNIRELQNVLRRYIAHKNLEFLKVSKLKSLISKDKISSGIPTGKAIPLKDAVGDFEKNHIQNILNQNQWNKGKSANILNISRKTLFRKMKAHELI